LQFKLNERKYQKNYKEEQQRVQGLMYLKAQSGYRKISAKLRWARREVEEQTQEQLLLKFHAFF